MPVTGSPILGAQLRLPHYAVSLSRKDCPRRLLHSIEQRIFCKHALLNKVYAESGYRVAKAVNIYLKSTLGAAMILRTGMALATVFFSFAGQTSAQSVYDGDWVVQIVVTATNDCKETPSASLLVTIKNNRIRGHQNSPSNLVGRIDNSGHARVSAKGSSDKDVVSATGVFSANAAKGEWRADQRKCKGTWTAARQIATTASASTSTGSTAPADTTGEDK